MLTKIKKYAYDVMSNKDGEPSSKRFVTMLAVLMMSVGYFANLFWSYTVEQFMFESVMYVVIAGLGFCGAEQFAPKSKIHSEEVL